MSTPEVFFRETIDLGRYSNSVSRKFVSTYNDIIVASAKKLTQIDLRQQAAAEGVTAAVGHATLLRRGPPTPLGFELA